jgi:putative ABC transport system permease protein
MLSISEVARQDVVTRIERLGLNNVIIDSVKPESVRGRESSENEDSWIAHYGLTKKDLAMLTSNVSGIRTVLPMRIILQGVSARQRTADITVVGTGRQYPDVMQHHPVDGRFFNAVDEANLRPVCVLGQSTADKLFPLESPLGQVVRIGGNFFRVIGMMEGKGQLGAGGKFADPDNSVFIPFETTFTRFGSFQYRLSGNVQEATNVEIDRAVVQVDGPAMLSPVSQMAANFLKRLHRKEDFAVTIPFTLLKERRESENVFRWVMGSLAAISLLVGGIGIMNIMLANVAERRAEIGLRRALGAKRGDILALFVSESLMLCLLGGAMGVATGLGLARLVASLAQWSVVYHPLSIPLGILVSLLVGLVFGTLPAMRAANEDPVMALRSE